MRISVEWVESESGKWSRDEPFVVRLVKLFVEEWNVKPSMNPVDGDIVEDHECDHGNGEVEQSTHTTASSEPGMQGCVGKCRERLVESKKPREFCNVRVHLAVTSNFRNEPRDDKSGNRGLNLE